jgi:hypothetical protein
MNSSFVYRLKLAVGFLREAEQDVALQRWRSAWQLFGANCWPQSRDRK